MPKIELLSPAKNLECGIAAVNHGADAVYIGAPRFSARAAAGSSAADIGRLAKYAHSFRAKVFAALNTVLTDEQLPEAEKIIWQLYEAGVDALIIQDMGILKLSLPPLALHASTQTDNRTIDKVRFLQHAGFSRVVLARELSLEQISSISANTDVELEAFVHGALCVSYSGQCYISQAACGRSANRGECAQYCRLPYDLVDAGGRTLIKNKHLLSLKDLNLSEHLEQLIDAGVTSFKIEGRLKDISYVKNTTAFYRKKLDELLAGKKDYEKSSAGKTYFFFTPDPVKSFNRGFTTYFLHGRQAGIMQPDTPKSIGEPAGKVEFAEKNYLMLAGSGKINNGDGLCYFDESGCLKGFRVNKAEDGLVYPAEVVKISQGTEIYRNYDAAFEKMMQQKTSERKISISIVFCETDDGFSLRIIDEEGTASVWNAVYEKQAAKRPEAVNENIKKQLSKFGGTIYEVRSVDIEISGPWFFPNSILNEWRRQAAAQLDDAREKACPRTVRKEAEKTIFPEDTLSYRGNVTNKLSEKFYTEHGVNEIEYGLEAAVPQENIPLMFCRHCIKYAMGWCPKQKSGNEPNEPLWLRNNNQLYRLFFDCRHCEMIISREK